MLEKSNRNENLSGKQREGKKQPTAHNVVSVLWSKMFDISQFHLSKYPNIYISCRGDDVSSIDLLSYFLDHLTVCL